jgi:hypothetical protein
MAGVVGAVRGMPWSVAVFLAYALLILTGIGLSLGFVVEQALDTPMTFTGVVVMALLAYTIFTVTLVLQRKAAARGLALGLSTLTIPAIPFLWLGGLPLVAVALGGLGVLLFRGLRSRAAGAWLSEP